MSLSSGLIKGCFGAALGSKTEENENVLRFYGFEGEAGGEGEGFTRIRESNHRRASGSARQRVCMSMHDYCVISTYTATIGRFLLLFPDIIF